MTGSAYIQHTHPPSVHNIQTQVTNATEVSSALEYVRLPHHSYLCLGKMRYIRCSIWICMGP